MMQQARMASLGQTAAGVAHEINNPLSFVTNNITLLKREVTGLHDVLLLYQQAEQTLAQYQRDLLGKISDLAEEVDLPYVLENLSGLMERTQRGLLRIQKIVADLRDFAHLEEAEFKEADLNARNQYDRSPDANNRGAHVRSRSRRTWPQYPRRAASRPRSIWWFKA